MLFSEYTKHRIFQIFLEQSERWVLWVPVLFGAGVILYFSLPTEPDFLHTSLLLLLFSCLAFCCYKWWKALFLPGLMGLFVVTGFTAAHIRTNLVAAPVITEEVGPTWVRGNIVSIDSRVKGQRVLLENVSIWKYPKEKTPKRVRINIRTSMNGAMPGDYISVRAKLLPPAGPVYPGDYDFARWAFFEKIGATGFALRDVELRETRNKPIKAAIANLRHIITNKIGAAFPADSKISGIASAMLTGEKGAIQKDVLEDIRNSGLAHLLAISGLHLVLVTVTFFVFFRSFLALIEPVALRYPIKKWASVLALLAGLFYLLISGMPVSAVRAYIMTGLFFLAVIVDRTGSPLRPVAIAAMIVLSLEPEQIFTPSFQMSFAAALALVAAYEKAGDWLRPGIIARQRPIMQLNFYVGGVIFSSLIAGFATAPFGIYHFGQYTPYGVAANLIAIPLTSFIVMPFGMLAVMLMPLGLSWLAFAPMGWGIELILKISEHISNLSYSGLAIPPMSDYALVLIALGGIWLCLWRKRLRLLGLVGIVPGLVMAGIQTSPDILVEGRGKLFALNAGNDELIFSSRNFARYARGVWSEQSGQSKRSLIIKDLKGKHNYLKNHKGVAINCDESSCFYKKAEQSAHIIFGAGKAADCTADIIINLYDDKTSCPAAYAITPDDLEKNGTHIIFLRESGNEIKTVGQERGKRLWTGEH